MQLAKIIRSNILSFEILTKRKKYLSTKWSSSVIMTDELSIPGGKKSFLPDSDRCPVLFLALLTYVSPKLWRIQIEVFYQCTAWSLPLDLEEQKCDLKK